MVTIVKAIADGTSASQVVTSSVGHVNVGGPASTGPSTATPRDSRPVVVTTTVAATSTTSAHGTARAILRPTKSATTPTAAMSTDQPLAVDRPPTRSATFAVNSPPESILIPSILAT